MKIILTEIFGVASGTVPVDGLEAWQVGQVGPGPLGTASVSARSKSDSDQFDPARLSPLALGLGTLARLLGQA